VSLIKAFWVRLPRPGNFGDKIGPWLIREITGTWPLYRRPRCNCEVHLTVGSIIRLAKGRNIIWGSGIIDSKEKLTRGLDIRAVRGPHTLKKCQQGGQWVEAGIPMGDPALLMPRFYTPKRLGRRWSLGIVPHYVDLEDPRVKAYRRDGAKIISPLQSVTKVLDQICACDAIRSSSLHGLIIAEAYGVPYERITLGGRLTGDGVKFRDFKDSLGDFDADALMKACPFK